MPEAGPEVEFYEELCRDEFGRFAPSVLSFLEQYKKRGAKLEDPKKDFQRTVANLFNDGIQLRLRAFFWECLEEKRRQKSWTQEQLAEQVALVSSTYSKIQSGLSTVDTTFLFFRALGIELRDLVYPSHCDLTIAGFLHVLPLVQYEALARARPVESAGSGLSREDLEWLIHLTHCEAIWTIAFVSDDKEKGDTVAACVAGGLSVRLQRPVAPRPFSDLGALWHTWFWAWQRCREAIPTWRML